MAKAAKTAKPSAPIPPDSIDEAAIFAHFWALLTEAGWRGATLAALAEAVGIDDMILRRHYGDQSGLLRAALRLIDEGAIDSADLGQDQPIRDNLFALLMARFDQMAPIKAAITRLRQDLRHHLVPALILAHDEQQRMVHFLQAAGAAGNGLTIQIKGKALLAIWLSCLAVWEADDSPDLAKSMAHLDKQLGRAHQWAQRLCRYGTTHEKAQAPAA